MASGAEKQRALSRLGAGQLRRCDPDPCVGVISIVEFPTTLEALRASHEPDFKVLMGTPNSVLGGAHSGRIAAELAQYDRLGILSRDYCSASLLQVAWLLVDEDNGYDLPRAKSVLACLPIG